MVLVVLAVAEDLDDAEVEGLNGATMSWRVPWLSSASSVISSSFLLEEPLDEQVDGAAVCREHADARAASLSSSADAMEMVVSCGVNWSATAVKCTATRAASKEC